MNKDLEPEETELRGEWLKAESKVIANATCRRIEWLIESRLEKLGTKSGGWETLYRDPKTRFLGEHTYPHSEMHGGGPPMLRVNSAIEARSKYGESAV